MAIRQQLLGEEHPDYATGQNDLAALYRAMGAYGLAKPLYRQALEIRKEALGEGHPDYALSLNNLAGCITTWARTAGPSRSFARPWRSGRRPWGRGTPTMP